MPILAHQPQRLGRDLVGDAAHAARLEQHDRAVGLRRRAGVAQGEQRALQVQQHRRVGVASRRQLDQLVRPRRQRVHRRAHRGEGLPPRLVGQRHGHRPAAGQGAQRRQLDACHVLESVREHRRAVPGVQPRRDQLGAARPHPRAVERAQRGQPLEVRRTQRPDLVEALTAVQPRQPPHHGGGLVAHRQLVEHPRQPVGEARRPRRGRQRLQLGRADHLGQHQPPLRRREHQRRLAGSLQHQAEEVVERPHRPAQDGAPAAQQLALHQLGVRAVGDDQERVLAAVDRVEEALHQERHLPAVGGTTHDRQRHRLDSRGRRYREARRRPRHAAAAGVTRVSSASASGG